MPERHRGHVSLDFTHSSARFTASGYQFTRPGHRVLSVQYRSLALSNLCTLTTGVPLVGQTRSPPAKSDACSSSQVLDDLGTLVRSALSVCGDVCAATCRRATRASLPTSSSIFAGLPPFVNGTLATTRPMAVSRMRVSRESRTMSLAKGKWKREFECTLTSAASGPDEESNDKKRARVAA